MTDDHGRTRPLQDRPFTPEWLIILTMPNTGSTALAQLLLSAPDTVSLNALAEGYRILPEMAAPPARWRADLPIDYDRAKTLWLQAVRERADEGCSQSPLVVEKSPSNLVRYKAILQMLSGMKTSLALLTRDPYATCASWNKRYDETQVTTVWGRETSEKSEENAYFVTLAELWIARLELLAEARASGGHWIRYEDFTSRPDRMAAELSDAIGRPVVADPQARIVVKDYNRQKVVNMNDKQIGLLSEQAKDGIASVLSKQTDLLTSFGYDAAPPATKVAAGA